MKKHKVNSAEELAALLNGRETSPGQHMARCPAHDDSRPSLAIKQGNHKILLHCFFGCEYQDILKALNEEGILLDHSKGSFEKGKSLPQGIPWKWNDKKSFVAKWRYSDEEGKILGHVVRYDSKTGEKDIIPFFKKENRKWKAGFPNELKKNNSRPLYNLHKIARAPKDEVIWVVEGEKCADALSFLGVLSTTSLGGSNAASKSDWSPLADRKVVIWPDNDQAGKAYAANVLRQLLGNVIPNPTTEIEIIDVENLGLDEKQDVYDWIERGHGSSDLSSLPRKQANRISDIGVIHVDPGNIHQAVDQAEKMLMKKNPHAIFQHCGRLVRVSRTTRMTPDSQNEQNIGIVEVTHSYLIDLFDRELTFIQENRGELKPIDPPAKLAHRYLARSGHWKPHILAGLTYAPTLRPDGTILDKPGYDPETGLFFDNARVEFRPLKEDLTKADAQKALVILRELFVDFPFIGEEDESVVLAAILTSLVRPILVTAPIFGFSAPTPASGKTLLADVVSIISTGRKAVPAPIGRDNEEKRKHLFASLLQGKPIILLDNLEVPLSSDVLSMILTAPGGTYADRILGKSEMGEVPTSVTFLATGNNLSFEGDMTRRALLCTIDPKCEKPEERSDFKVKRLNDYVLQRRKRYIKAALTILRAYAKAEWPDQGLPLYGSFESWSKWVRSPLVWLGCADPCLTRKRIEQNDPSKVNLARILILWKEIYDLDDPIKTFEIVRDCNKAIEGDQSDNPEYELAQVLMEVTRCKGKQLDPGAVGRWLKNNKDRILGGLKIIKNPNSPGNRAEWMLTSV